AAGVGEEAVEAAGHVAEVEADGGRPAGHLPELLGRERQGEPLHVLPRLQQRVGHRLEGGGDARDGAAEPDFGEGRRHEGRGRWTGGYAGGRGVISGRRAWERRGGPASGGP